MDLKGAKLRNFYQIGAHIEKAENCPMTFSIPHYQRPFSWEAAKVELLVNDYFEKTNKKDREYFTGTIVTVINNRSHDLVDGQQRYTTIFLANVLKFLVMRLYFKEAIKVKNQNTSLKIKEFIQCCSFLFEKQIINENKLKKILKEGTSPKFIKKHKKILSDYCKIVGIPDMQNDKKEYESLYCTKTLDFFKKNPVRLKYARLSYNDQLILSFSNLMLKLSTELNLTLDPIEDKKNKNNNVDNYLKALSALFNAFKKDGWDKSLDVLENTDIYLEKVNMFLDGVNVCVVQTGNLKDAYTLFEVLNDRGMALDDLDLIKNYFYQNYVKLNPKVKDKVLDITIDKLEAIWSTETFEKDDPDFFKRLVIYCGIIFLTGETNVKNEKGGSLRECIGKYLKSKKDYSEKEIESDFKVFYRIKVLFKEVGFAYSGAAKDLNAIKAAAIDDNVSYIKKVISLIFALKLDGVMPAITNMYLSLKIDISKDLKPISELMKETSAASKFLNFEKNSYHLFNLILCSKDYTKAKPCSDSIVKQLNKSKQDTKIESFIHELKITKAVENDFKIQMNNWRYKHDLKVRILFLLLNTFTVQGKFLRKNFNVNKIAGIEKLNLDHLEPTKVDLSNKTAYFIDKVRESFVDSLGNMMILDKGNNVSKSNCPLKDCFKFMEKSGFTGTFLYNDLKEIFRNNNKKKVPTRKFFEQRTERLICLFSQILALPHGSDKIDI